MADGTNNFRNSTMERHIIQLRRLVLSAPSEQKNLETCFPKSLIKAEAGYPYSNENYIYWVYLMCFKNLICLFQVVYSAGQPHQRSKKVMSRTFQLA